MFTSFQNVIRYLKNMYIKTFNCYQIIQLKITAMNVYVLRSMTTADKLTKILSLHKRKKHNYSRRYIRNCMRLLTHRN